MTRFIQLFLGLTIFFTANVLRAQTMSCDQVDKELAKLYSKIFPFYENNPDSLDKYSDLFSGKLTDYIKDNSLTLDCEFKLFQDSVGSIVTSNDGLFRIYSWDTRQGGTMDDYKNIFQFKSGDKVYTANNNYGVEDNGTYFTDISSLTANSKTYYLAIGGGSESSKDGYELIRVYSISENKLNDSIPIIKTSSGLKNSIFFEYNIFSVIDKPERPISLIKYDANKKIIYIPIVLEDGKVTDRFILYQFTGQYFEKLLVQKKSDSKK